MNPRKNTVAHAMQIWSCSGRISAALQLRQFGMVSRAVVRNVTNTAGPH